MGRGSGYQRNRDAKMLPIGGRNRFLLEACVTLMTMWKKKLP